jgi:hypothetical protein
VNNCAQFDFIFDAALVVKSTEMEPAGVDARASVAGSNRTKRVDSTRTFVESRRREELRLLAIGNIFPKHYHGS